MKYFALLTKLGENLLAQATALGTKLELTHMAVGDGGGSLPTPDTNQTKLIAEKRRAAINTLFIDEQNKNQIIAEQIIPEQDGGWWIREIGLFDKAGNLIAVANCPETYKPQLAEGSGRTQSIRMVLIVSHTESVTLKIDPSVVLATREYVNTEITVLDKKIDALSAQTKLDLNKKIDKANIAQQKGNSRELVASQDLLTTEVGKLATKAELSGKISNIRTWLQDGLDILERLPNEFSGTFASGSNVLNGRGTGEYLWLNHSGVVPTQNGVLIHYSLLIDNPKIWVKVLSGGRWGEWSDCINSTELAKELVMKLDKSGGTVTGDIIFEKGEIKSPKGTHVLPERSGQLVQVGDFGLGSAFHNLLGSSDSSCFISYSAIDDAINDGFPSIGAGLQSTYGAARRAQIFIDRNTNGFFSRFSNVAGADKKTRWNEHYTTANVVVDRNGHLKAVGTTELSDYPIGAPIPWPQTTAPAGYLVCNGQSFNKTTYPRLAAAYPSGKLPDMRSEFIRGLDSGRNIDTGRTVLSIQGDAIRNITGKITEGWLKGVNVNDVNSALYVEKESSRQPASDRAPGSTGILFDASRSVPTANENRPRNIAFLYIVRAA